MMTFAGRSMTARTAIQSVVQSQRCTVGSSLHSHLRRTKATQTTRKYSDEELCIPRERSWSVHELLDRNALNTKELSEEELDKLYRLAALQSPQSQSERDQMKEELRGMIRLVDAVKYVDTSSISPDEAMHSTVWPDDQSLRLHEAKGGNVKPNEQMVTDQATSAMARDDLLKLARRTLGKAYVVDRE